MLVPIKGELLSHWHLRTTFDVLGTTVDQAIRHVALHPIVSIARHTTSGSSLSKFASLHTGMKEGLSKIRISPNRRILQQNVKRVL